MAAAHLGHRHPSEVRARISAALSGRLLSAEHRSKLIGRSRSEEHRRHISEAKRGGTPWNKGLVDAVAVSSETRQRMSEAQKARAPASIETRQKRSRIRKGMRFSTEWRENIRLSRLGTTLSEETKQRIAESCAHSLAQRVPTNRLELALRSLLEEQGVTDLVPQQRFGKFVADWYSPSLNAIFEADGVYWHDIDRDAMRDEEIQSRFGVETYRFTDAQIAQGEVTWPA